MPALARSTIVGTPTSFKVAVVDDAGLEACSPMGLSVLLVITGWGGAEAFDVRPRTASSSCRQAATS